MILGYNLGRCNYSNVHLVSRTPKEAQKNSAKEK